MAARGHNQRRYRQQQIDAEVPDDKAFEMTAALFSVATHQSAGTLTMRYTGEKREEALQLFARRLERLAPGAVCAGWR
jgi:hypothetical protein